MNTDELIDNLDGLFAGLDTPGSGIRSPELMQRCLDELESRAQFPELLDIIWDISVRLYGQPPYTAEDRLHFIAWLRDELEI